MIWALASLPALHPLQLWAAPWSVAAWLYALRLLPYRTLSWETVALVLGATAAFAAGAVATGGRGTDQKSSLPWLDAHFTMLRRAAGISVGISAILLGAFLIEVISRFGFHAAIVSSVFVRYAIAHGYFPVTIKFVYAAFGAIALTAVVVALAPSRKQMRVWLVVLVLCVASLYFSTGRATVVDGGLVAAVAVVVTRTRLPSRARLVAGGTAALVLAMGVFLAGGALIGKTFSNDPDLQSVPSVFVRHDALADLALPYQYVTAPIAALDVQVHAATVWGDGRGCAAFPYVCSVMRKTGLHVPSVPTVRPFTAPPLAWNTYTALDVPLIDGGTALTIPIMALLGIVSGLVWKTARRRHVVGIVAYALLAVALVTGAGSFNFTASFLVGGFLIAIVAVGLGRLAADLRPAIATRSDRATPPVFLDQ